MTALNMPAHTQRFGLCLGFNDDKREVSDGAQ